MSTPTNPPDPARQSAEERARDLYRSLQVPIVTDLDARLRVSQDARDKLAKIEAAIRAAHAEGRQAGLEEAARIAEGANVTSSDLLGVTGDKKWWEGYWQSRKDAWHNIRALARSTPPPPCTCGSGGHPRKCTAHPGVFAWHVEALNAENRVADLEKALRGILHAEEMGWLEDRLAARAAARAALEGGRP